MRRLLLLVVALVALAGCAVPGPGGPGTAARPPDATGRPAAPVTLDVPAIGVHASLMRLGLAPDGTVEVPPLGSPDAGWYVHSPVPGDVGPAVLLGHLDSARSGPAVFYRLGALTPGDEVRVTRDDGSVVAFRVDRVAEYPKAAFPVQAVYGDVDRPELRLVTCGGSFDAAARSYRDNVVVFASEAV